MTEEPQIRRRWFNDGGTRVYYWSVMLAGFEVWTGEEAACKAFVAGWRAAKGGGS